ncbi:MAG: AarF/ABC1/UbiB kinase family protein [Alphaproteobacteria bacterium]|nr:AarF/ABC1/UbiB kinase family protein [Alphaproteobacteria bacterium]
MADKNTLSGRIKRHASVAGAMSGVAAQAAGKKFLGIEINHAKHAVELRHALGGLKGPLMKIAQILSTIPDAVPPEYTKELAMLQADAPAMGWLFVKRRMMGELGADWQSKFKSFEQSATAAASLGQVHKAVTLKNVAVACKLQYPDMNSAVEADLKQLAIIFSIFEMVDKAVSTKDIQKEIADRLREELDYVREAKHIALYSEMLAGIDTVHVPHVLPELSTSRLLTMSWLEGERMGAVAETRDLAARNDIAMNMFHAWYAPFYNYGIIHGDPHLGNYSVRKDNSINLLDFGCIRIFRPGMVGGVIELYHALVENDHERAVEAYKEWGFTKPSKALIETLNLWARFIYAPLLEDRKRLIEETNTGLYGREVAAKVHEELRKLGGGVSVPREFVFMDRAAIGLGSVFLRLKAEINWYEMFHDLIKDFEVKRVTKNQEKLLHKHGLTA